LADLKLVVTFSVPRQSRVRISRETDAEDLDTWTSREEEWKTFWKARGLEGLLSGKKATAKGDTFRDIRSFRGLTEQYRGVLA
jgi:hypothetical protein